MFLFIFGKTNVTGSRVNQLKRCSYKTVIAWGFLTTLTPRKPLKSRVWFKVIQIYVKNLIKHQNSLRWLGEWLSARHALVLGSQVQKQ